VSGERPARSSEPAAAPQPYLLAAADFHAQVASVFESMGQTDLGALARRKEVAARRRAHERARPAAR
jgi:hypothetical protein